MYEFEAQAGTFDGKNGGRKSRIVVPLRHIKACCKLKGQLIIIKLAIA
jgi:hypothetical protein